MRGGLVPVIRKPFIFTERKTLRTGKEVGGLSQERCGSPRGWGSLDWKARMWDGDGRSGRTAGPTTVLQRPVLCPGQRRLEIANNILLYIICSMLVHHEIKVPRRTRKNGFYENNERRILQPARISESQWFVATCPARGLWTLSEASDQSRIPVFELRIHRVHH